MQDGIWPAVPNSVTVNGISVPGYLIADGIYPAELFIGKPYRGAALSLTSSQRCFNFVQSSTRQPLEHTNGILKKRWQILSKHEEPTTLKKAVRKGSLFEQLLIRLPSVFVKGA